MGKQSREKKEKRNQEEQPEKKVLFSSGFEKACLFVITCGIYIVLFSPLVVSTKFFFPFVAPKTTFFRIGVEIIFAAYLLLAASNSRYRPKINPLAIAVFLFIAVFILTSFTGINFDRSFWSTYERMTGIWTMLHLLAFFIVLSGVFKERKDWERLLGVSIIVGVILSLYILSGKGISTRGGGTIGNTSFMAAYLLFDIFFAVALFLSKKGGWRIFAGISLVPMLYVVFDVSARGAHASFWLGIFLLAMGYLFFSRRKNLKRLAWAVVLFLIISVSLALVFQPPFLKDRADKLLYKQMTPRFTVWEMAWEGFKERPVLGWGPENFNVAFNQNFNPCLFTARCGKEIWFDRAHNIVMDTLVTMGAVGFLSYLAIFGTALFGILKIIPRISNIRDIFLPLGMGVLLVIYFFHNMLVFDMINTYLVFFLVLAFIGFLVWGGKEEAEPKRRKVGPFFGSLVLVATLVSLYLGNIQPIKAGYHTVQMLGIQELEASIDNFKKSLNSLMIKYEPREHFSQRVTRNIVGQSGQAQYLLEASALAKKEMEKSAEQNSLDFRPHLFLGKLYNVSYYITQNSRDLVRAEEVLTRAIELSPTNQQGYWYLGEVMLPQGRSEEAVALFEKALELEPEYDQSRWYLAMAYSATGKPSEARREMEKIESYWQNDVQNLKKAINIYIQLQDDQALVPLYLKVLESEPDNSNIWASLAASYANTGQIDKARQAALKAVEINPDLTSKIQEFLDSLPQ